ncbi:hypothetical protein Nitsa_1809 [Nitratifractor salsuginis DSM 16511]|uniref:Uncharacterized protein n=1 Tax=Nitratifractor salsuginis (strain DSM 16511 / JCM 12458 / E9I37-1) TaxID=749222 RepID=E6X1R3_NITSE|nr:hypothetical protein Nitsa_1809 [Nitratifractor salsuginis DSM 16511]
MHSMAWQLKELHRSIEVERMEFFGTPTQGNAKISIAGQSIAKQGI